MSGGMGGKPLSSNDIGPWSPGGGNGNPVTIETNNGNQYTHDTGERVGSFSKAKDIFNITLTIVLPNEELENVIGIEKLLK